MGLNTAWRFPVDVALRRWVFPGLLLSLSISLIRSVASRILFGDWECLLWVGSRPIAVSQRFNGLGVCLRP
jgi:hypothetical protein